MEVLHENLDINRYYYDLERTDQRILMLDYDGTLAPFVVDRDKAVPYPGVRDLLADLMSDSPTRVVIVSGRSVNDLMHLLDMDSPPELWGSHGFEQRLPSGEMMAPDLPDSTREMLDEIARWSETHIDSPQCEPKPAGYAFHWRGTDDETAAGIRRTVKDQWAERLPRAGLSLHEFDGGLEIRPRDTNKGHAVRRLLADVSPDCIAAYLGDDLTDEDAFAAMEHLQDRALTVLVRHELRPTIAKVWLRPPEELLRFMRRWM